MGERVALVLSSGGARGAYEAGVLSVLLPELERRGQRPTVLVGTSAGALNATSLAADADQNAEVAASRLVQRWRALRHSDVFHSISRWQAPWSAFGYVGEVLGLPGVCLPGFLDPAPLRGSLDRMLDWPAVHRNVRDGVLDCVAVVASHAANSRSTVFVEGHRQAGLPAGRTIDYVAATLSNDHLMASAAIPMLFPAVRVEEPVATAGWYYDGSARLSTPLEPALELDVDRVAVVGTHSIAPRQSEFWSADDTRPDFADGAVQLLTAMLIAPMIEDVRRLGQVNELVSGADKAVAAHRRALDKKPYRHVPYMFVAPATRGVLGDIASEVFRRNYRGYRAVTAPDLVILSRLLGGESEQHGELISYLLFERDFLDEAITLGSYDAQRWFDRVPGPSAPWYLPSIDTLSDS
ncbi:MAG: patatin [Pseudonocardiaceae bacterium]|nr:patatin [Pseudonocardiaceae bacterium]